MANEQLFHLGRLVGTPGALAAIEEAGESAATYLARHATGDWGDLTEFDSKANESAIKRGDRVLSSYRLASGVQIYVLTDAANDDGNRASTTVVLAAEH